MWEPAPTRRDCTLLLPLLAPPSPLVQGVELPGLGLTALREDESQREKRGLASRQCGGSRRAGRQQSESVGGSRWSAFFGRRCGMYFYNQPVAYRWLTVACQRAGWASGKLRRSPPLGAGRGHLTPRLVLATDSGASLRRRLCSG